MVAVTELAGQFEQPAAQVLPEPQAVRGYAHAAPAGRGPVQDGADPGGELSVQRACSAGAHRLRAPSPRGAVHGRLVWPLPGGGICSTSPWPL
jgi:hypothetical protein